MSKLNNKLHRIHPIVYVVIVIAILAMTITASKVYAWYVDSIQNRDNLLTTSSKSAILLSTDKPYISISNQYPSTVSDLLIDGNGLISIDDSDKTTRKFLELDGNNSISGVVPGFKYVRPIIVANETDADISYSVEFLCTNVNDIPLSSSMYLNYAQLGTDIDNAELTEDSGLSIPKGITVENMAFDSVRIGESRMIKLPSGKSHIYMVEFGLLSTAGNASRGAGVWLDIMLFSTQNDNTVHSVYDQVSLRKAIADNSGGDTIMLIKDVGIDSEIISNDVFNLDLNGFTLDFKQQGKLIVNYPNELASMEFGSEAGGKIITSIPQSIKLNGVAKKSSIVWYTGIADFDSLVVAKDVHIINTDLESGSSNDESSRPAVSDISSSSTPPSSGDDVSSNTGSSDNSSSNISSDNTSSDSTSSSETSSDSSDALYQNFDDIMEKSYSRDETGTLANPYTINSVEQFKCFIYDDSADLSKWYKITADISYLKGIPYEFITQKKTRIIINDNVQISNLKIKKSSTSDIELSNPFKNCTIFSEDGVTVSGEVYISNINYY